MKELYMQYLFLYEQYIGLRNNKFDSRTNIRYGNGTYSEYYYDPLNRRLKNLKSYDANGLKMHDIDYGYDGVGNILHQSNNGEYVYNGAGGPYKYDYKYDELYRLIHSGGNFESNHNGNMYYNLNMSYSPSGNITNKQLYGQTLINGGVNNIDYNRDYQYNGRPHQVTNAGENEYEWDGNGNMIFRNTPQGRRYQCWDNEDRLVAVHDEGDMPQISAYLYDGGGERVWKLTGGVIQNYMNGQQIYSSGHLDKTLYASPYMVMTEKEYTKHYYIEGERICSKIGSGFQGVLTPPTSTPIDFIAGSAQICSILLREMVNRNVQCARYDGGIDIDPYLPPAHNNGNEYEKLQYFYHSDHLGSASFITDISGYVMQHLQYFPYGELFVSQRNSEFDTRYKFTAKELDNETSYTYFGARYYDSELSGWLSIDPMSDKYPSLSPYCYSADNPVVLVDPNGMWIDDYYFNTETKQISVIKTNDNFDRLIINGINKGTYNKGYLDKIANISRSGGYTFNELEIKYTKNVDQSKISYYTRAILVDAMNKSKNNSILITSGTRTPEDQARIMKNNVDIHGMESQKSLYKAPGQQVLDYYPDQEAMTDEIYRLGPSNVSKHCGDPNKINVLDIAPSSIKYQNEFKNAILNDSRVSKLLYPPKDPALHLEIPQ